MIAKPGHLGPGYARQFEDESIARAYFTRPPYPPELFSVLGALLPPGSRSVLDLGCGTGDIALGLIGTAERIDAVDPSHAMLRVASSRDQADHPSLSWCCASAEEFGFDQRYGLVVAAESLHWMDWDIVLPRMARCLLPGGQLAIVGRVSSTSVPWSGELELLLQRFSTNREYQPYDLISELQQRGYFREAGRRQTAPVAFRQPIDEYMESFHSRNGFSRQRMSLQAAADFDRGLRELVLRHRPDGVVQLGAAARVTWGRPLAPAGAPA
jgi:ubiquinone/menaquinone biosynthesis C-methylase UbiE